MVVLCWRYYYVWIKRLPYVIVVAKACMQIDTCSLWSTQKNDIYLYVGLYVIFVCACVTSCDDHAFYQGKKRLKPSWFWEQPPNLFLRRYCGILRLLSVPIKISPIWAPRRFFPWWLASMYLCRAKQKKGPTYLHQYKTRIECPNRGHGPLSYLTIQPFDNKYYYNCSLGSGRQAAPVCLLVERCLSRGHKK